MMNQKRKSVQVVTYFTILLLFSVSLGGCAKFGFGPETRCSYDGSTCNVDQPPGCVCKK